MGIVAIDGGGTKTLGVLVRSDGTLLSAVQRGPSNMNGDHIRAFQALTDVVSCLCGVAIQCGEKIEVIFAGLAGIEQGDNRQQVKTHLQQLCQQSPLMKETLIEVDNDAVTALYSGTLGEPGIVQIAGTGSITYGVHANGTRERVGGWGYIIGDAGSGYAIGSAGLTAVFRAWDGLDAPTVITPILQESYSLQTITELIPMIYTQNGRQQVAAVAPFVLRAADLGDEAALRIVMEAAQEMGQAITALYRKLYGGLPSVLSESSETSEKSKRIQVVLTGGVFQRADLLLPTIENVCCAAGMQAQFTLPDHPPVAGAVFAGLRRLNIPLPSQLCAQISQQLAAMKVQ
ncbi:BadF/BadG/BcrA/BcrD ATPase family protein [Paenibacillus sp. UMB4589-SE434]|uniref:N-acetylglucosamine kinase n=1 Tax=Paenibacillus sp. UMB4589-SE434 TaxID=3046314 RepID=UPI002550FB69|nr:BadF/BadG/BcrA/BcrD ATPase family protein [Paenibacillus sp. UMB4589-SE434]MDK8182427.1 BadF/BadG/BcrA/BcrD ATPase family protein [Paenibacillus sp. UMB4589-SE434]